MQNCLLVILLSGLFSQASSQTCTRIIHQDDFSSNQGYTSVGNGNVSISGGMVQWIHAICGNYDYLYRLLNDTVSDNYFRAEFDFTVLPNPVGHGVGAVLLALTGGTQDFLCYDASGNFATTDQDGLGVCIESASTQDNNIDNWSVYLEIKAGNVRTQGINSIPLFASISNYFLVFERLSPTLVSMQLYTDSSQTILLGQAINSINPGIDSLSVVQYGITTWGWNTREFNGYMDDLIICDDVTTGLDQLETVSLVTVPSGFIENSGFMVSSSYLGTIDMVVHDITGKQVHQQRIGNGDNLIYAPWSSGMYSVNFNKKNHSVYRKLLFAK